MRSVLLQLFTAIQKPTIDFVEIAKGMGVPGGTATTCEEFFDLMARSEEVEGPFLINALF